MKTVLSIIMLLMLILSCAAEEAPYFEQHGIEIDYNQDIDLHKSHPGGVLEISPYEEAPQPWRADVRFVILKDETSGDTRTIEAGMVVTVVDKIWTSTPYNNLTAFGAYDYYTGAQLDIGLDGVDMSRVVIAYEPIWSIGPGKTPADKPYITKIARFVKERTGGLDVVYGGGLKKDNAAMLASIEEIDGDLIALTRFAGEIGFYPDEYLEIIDTYLG